MFICVNLKYVPEALLYLVGKKLKTNLLYDLIPKAIGGARRPPKIVVLKMLFSKGKKWLK